MFARPSKSTFSIVAAVVCILCAVFLLIQTLNPKTPDWITATVERGDVSEVVSVSGFIEAKNTAELAFPTVGKVTEVFVTEGDTVNAGEVLATLASNILVAERNDASAQLRIAQAQYDTLLSGETTFVRAIAETNLNNAEQKLTRTVSEEKEKVSNAFKTLLSSGITALAKNANEDATPPMLSGSYICLDEGTYTLTVYASNAYSGISYRLAGLETATAQATTNQPSPLGACGLYITFTDGDSYHNSAWTIDIPNKQNPDYITNANAYALALESQANAVFEVEDARQLVAEQTAEINANPRNEEIVAAQGEIDKAKARIVQIDAQIDDRSVVAPFDGTVTDVSILRGETSPTTPVITIISFDAFELKARIPEIDITRIAVGQKTTTIFDAEDDETFNGEITYLSPLATLIDGVAYFEATITLQNVPTWIRSGLNADVDVRIKTKENVIRIPKRFLMSETDGSSSVYIQDGNKKATSSVEVITVGNEGYTEVSGLREGQIVVAP